MSSPFMLGIDIFINARLSRQTDAPYSAIQLVMMITVNDAHSGRDDEQAAVTGSASR
jgi:hypothetical protein